MLGRFAAPAAMVLVPMLAHARVGLVVGEPFGAFGTMMPQGHASVLLSDWCMASPVRLRPCVPGELPGVVISRYHDLKRQRLDWLATPAFAFFYGVDTPEDIPQFVTPGIEAELRERYREAHLAEIIPARIDRHGRPHPPPYGDWEEGIGAAFDRRLFVYTLDATPAQEMAIVDLLNGRPNRRRYTLARANCADFAAEMLALVLPPNTFRRNTLADFDMMTPKQLARLMDRFGNEHPERQVVVYEVPQLPGTLRRSRPLRGAAESLLTTKRYFMTLLVLQPELVLADWIVYENRGRWKPGLDAKPIDPMEAAAMLETTDMLVAKMDAYSSASSVGTAAPNGLLAK